MVQLYDRATIKGDARITREGYFVADALVARANNIQEYRASELGLTDRQPNDVVRVFRPEAEVFAADSLQTAVRLPITMDHPAGGMVDASNWREYARGETGDEIMRDGEFMRVPLRITDAAAIASVRDDRQEFSMGYTATLLASAGVHDGQAYDVTLSNIRYNHLAACRTARGGAELRIVDEQKPTGAPKMQIVMVDGLSVNVEDATAARSAIEKLMADRDAAVTDLSAARANVIARDSTIVEREAELVTLRDQVKSATPTPAALRAAAANFARVTDAAKRLGVAVTDAMDEPAIHAAAVSHKMGDAAKGYTPEQNATAFATLVAMLPADGNTPVVDGIANTIAGNGGLSVVNDAQKSADEARAKRLDRFSNAHRAPVAA